MKNSGFTTFDKGLLRKIQKWESAFRIAHREGTLSTDKFEILNGIDFIFSQEKVDEQIWDENFNGLIKYYKDSNTFIIPDEDDFIKLKRWVQYQRGLYKQNKLRADRVNRFIEIGYDFSNNYKAVSERTATASPC